MSGFQEIIYTYLLKTQINSQNSGFALATALAKGIALGYLEIDSLDRKGCNPLIGEDSIPPAPLITRL